MGLDPVVLLAQLWNPATHVHYTLPGHMVHSLCLSSGPYNALLQKLATSRSKREFHAVCFCLAWKARLWTVCALCIQSPNCSIEHVL